MPGVGRLNDHGFTQVEMALGLVSLVAITGTIAALLWPHEEPARAPVTAEEPPRRTAAYADLEYEIDDRAVSLLPGSGKTMAGRETPSAPSVKKTNGAPVSPMPKPGTNAVAAFAKTVAQSKAKGSTRNTNTVNMQSAPNPANTAKTRSAGIKPTTIRTLADQDIAALLEALGHQRWSRETEVELLQVMSMWALRDPQSALEYALDIEMRGTRNAALASALGIWTKRSPDAAFAWFKTTAANLPHMIESQTLSLFNNLAARDLGMAMSYVWELPTDNMKRIALGTVAGKLISKGREMDLLTLYDSSREEARKSIILNVVLQSMGRYEPNTLGSWVSSLPDPMRRSTALNTLISVWSSDHPRAAAEWVSTQLPEGADRARQINTVTCAWVKDNPSEAAYWLLSLLPPSGQTDPAVGSLARAIMVQNPGDAGAWSFSVTDATQRWKLMEEVGRSWWKSDPVQAKAYILKTDLPKAVKDRLLK